MLMTCREQGGKNGARLVNILAAALSGNEGSGYKVQEAPRSGFWFVTPYYGVQRHLQLTEYRTLIMEPRNGRNIKNACTLFP